MCSTFACKTVANMLETHRQRCEAEHVLSAAKVVALAAHLEQHGRRCATELVHPGVAAAERVAAAAGEAGADESWQTRSFSDTFGAWPKPTIEGSVSRGHPLTDASSVCGVGCAHSMPWCRRV